MNRWGASYITFFISRFELKFILQWRHNEHDGISNHRRLDRFINRLFRRLFRRRSKKISKFRITGLCGGNLPLAGESPSQRAATRKMIPSNCQISCQKFELHHKIWISYLYCMCCRYLSNSTLLILIISNLCELLHELISISPNLMWLWLLISVSNSIAI